MNRTAFVTSIILALAIIAAPAFAQSQPTVADFYGNVTIGTNTSTDGAAVQALVNGQVATVAIVGGGTTQGGVPTGMYLIHVSAPNGTNVTFRVGDVNATSTLINETLSRELYLVATPNVNGTVCTRGDTCDSGFCVDDYCCNTACGADNYDCNVAGSEGTCTSTASVSSTGGTGGGSSGGGGTTTPDEETPTEEPTTPETPAVEPSPVQEEETQTVGSVGGGQAATVEYIEDVAVDEITITPKSDASDVKVTVKRQPTAPSGVSSAPGSVYTYLDIGIENLESGDIESSSMTFKVDKSWVSSNNIDTGTVKLNVYSDGQWKEVETTLEKSDEGFYYFTADIEGAATYSITAASHAAPEPEPEPTPSPDYTMYYALALIVVVVIIALAYYFSRPKKKRFGR